MAGPSEIGAYVIVALFALVFMVFRKPLRYRGRPLAPLLLILVLSAALTAKLLCCPYLYRSLALYRFFPYLDQAIGFAVGPTFLLYVLISARKKRRFYFLHYALSAAAFSFFILYAASAETVRDARILSIINRTDIPSRLFNYALLLQFTAYFAAGLWMSRRPRWLAIAAAAGYVLFFPSAGAMYIWFYNPRHYFFIFALVSAVLFIIAGSAWRFLPAGPAAAPFSADGCLKDEAEKILEYIRAQKPYLDRHLTMAELSEKIGMSRHRLSEVINSYFAMGYSEFVANLRVEEAKKRIENDADEKITLEYLGYTCGFNSKTSFFTHFKKYTGMTPSDYVKHVRKENRKGGGGKGKFLLLFMFVLCAACIITALAGCKKEPSEIVVRRVYGRSAGVSAEGHYSGEAGRLSVHEGAGIPVVLEQLVYAKKYLFWGVFLFFLVSMLRRPLEKRGFYANR